MSTRRLCLAMVLAVLLESSGVDGEGEGMKRMKEWFDSGSIHHIQEASKHDSHGESAGQGGGPLLHVIGALYATP